MEGDYSYGGSSPEDSIALFDADYLVSPYDWLIMPDLELAYKQLNPDEEWTLSKSKKSSDIKKIYLTFHVVETEGLKRKCLKNLRNGYLTTKQLFSEKMDKQIKHFSLKFE